MSSTNKTKKMVEKKVNRALGKYQIKIAVNQIKNVESPSVTVEINRLVGRKSRRAVENRRTTVAIKRPETGLKVAMNRLVVNHHMIGISLQVIEMSRLTVEIVRLTVEGKVLVVRVSLLLKKRSRAKSDTGRRVVRNARL